MLDHYKQTTHCVALSHSDLSVWCFSCDSYLDAQLIQQLRPVHETAYILKFGEAPPLPSVEFSGTEDKPARDMPSSTMKGVLGQSTCVKITHPRLSKISVKGCYFGKFVGIVV